MEIQIPEFEHCHEIRDTIAPSSLHAEFAMRIVCDCDMIGGVYRRCRACRRIAYLEVFPLGSTLDMMATKTLLETSVERRRLSSLSSKPRQRPALWTPDGLVEHCHEHCYEH